MHSRLSDLWVELLRAHAQRPAHPRQIIDILHSPIHREVRIISPTLVVDHGWIRNARVLVRPQPGIDVGPLMSIHAIILHQTDSAKASATLNEYASHAPRKDGTTPPKGNGAHFLIDRDGTIYQCVALDRKCQHIGPIKARCMEEHNCLPKEQSLYEGILRNKQLSFSKQVMETALHDLKKDYPARYPSNSDAIGIEMVGEKLGDHHELHGMYQDENGPWQTSTPEQQASLQWLIRELLDTLHLQRTDIYRHPQVSRKSVNEAVDAKPF